MQKIKVFINGAAGKMGKLACEHIQQDDSLILVGQGLRGDNLQEKLGACDADVVVDLTSPSSIYENTLTIINAGKHPVIGTSGLLANQVTELQELCQTRKLGGIIAPNFSIGSVLLMQLSTLAAKHFPQVEIIEMHHDGKKDTPSGTALKTADMIAQHKAPYQQPDCHELLPGSRGASEKNIPIHAIRVSGVLAKQQVIFGGHGETLSIHHDSINRESFMPGLLMACREVINLQELRYGLETLACFQLS